MLRINTTPRIYHCEPDWTWTPPCFRDHDVWIVLDGIGEMTLNLAGERQTFALSAGHAFLFGPGTMLSARNDPTHPLTVFASHFTPVSTQMAEALEFGRAGSGQGPTFIHTVAIALPMISLIAEECAAHAFETDAMAQRHTAGLLRAIVLHVLFAHGRPSLAPGPARIARCVQEIRRAPGLSCWQSEEMARRCGFSVPQFNRHFRALTGDSPRQFVIHRRIERAQLLLQESDLTIEQIADALGYTDTFFFHRQFRSTTGITPQACRRGETAQWQPCEPAA